MTTEKRIWFVHFEQWGHGFILQGHGHDAHSIRDELELSFGPAEPGQQERIVEGFYSLQRRVKNCADHGDPCDLNGEWHAHWHQVRPAAGFEWTFAQWAPVSSSGVLS